MPAPPGMSSPSPSSSSSSAAGLVLTGGLQGRGWLGCVGQTAVGRCRTGRRVPRPGLHHHRAYDVQFHWRGVLPLAPLPVLQLVLVFAPLPLVANEPADLDPSGSVGSDRTVLERVPGATLVLWPFVCLPRHFTACVADK